MDFLECSICHANYDENEHRPRNSPCGHEYCSKCLKALIKNGEYVCPKCREKIKANVVEDLPVNFGLIDVIRAFKANTIILANEAESKVSESSNDVCSIHCQPISHWCSVCQLWLCVDCLNAHTSLIGCSTTNVTKAVEDLKDNHNKTVDQLMSKFEQHTLHVTSKIQEHTDKRKELLEMAVKHSKEVDKLQDILQQGNNHKDELLESKKHLNETYSPHAISDRIKVMTQRNKALLSWAANNIGKDAPLDSHQDLLKALKENSSVYVEKIIKEEKKHSTISLHEEDIYVHTFQKQQIPEKTICIPFVQLQKMIPSASSPLVFLDLSRGGLLKSRGRVLLRLNKDWPTISGNFIKLVTGEQCPSLKGISLVCGTSQLFKNDLPFSELLIPLGFHNEIKAKKGNICGFFGNGYLQRLYFQIGTFSNYPRGFCIIGNIVNGLDIMETYANNDYGEVTITDCGFVMEKTRSYIPNFY